MKRGHVVRGAKQQQPRQATLDKYARIAAAIQAQLAATPPAQLLTFQVK